MALALIDFIEFENDLARFNIDTGTNSFYKIKIGKSKTEISGVKWVDEIIHATALKNTGQNGNFFTNTEITLPSNFFNKNRCYVQLFSFKNESGKSPAFSKIVSMPTYLSSHVLPMSNSINYETMNVVMNDCRSIPDLNHRFAFQTGFSDIIEKIIQMATPIISNLIENGAKSEPKGNLQNTIGFLNTLINGLKDGFTNVPVTSQSIFDENQDGNRFSSNNFSQFSQPFVAFAALLPVLAPIIQAVAPQIIQAVPQLLQAHNEHKLKMRQENNKLNKDIFSDVNKRLMLLQILQNMPQNTPVANTDVNGLIQMIQQIPDGSSGTNAPTSNSQSLTFEKHFERNDHSVSLSISAILKFVFLKTQTWNGKECNVFSGNNIKLWMQLVVGGVKSKKSIPKAIIKISFRDIKSEKNYGEKIFKQKDVSPGNDLHFSFTEEDLARLPKNISLKVFSEMRWLTKSGKEIKALGSCEIILSDPYFVKDVVKPFSDEREPMDMKIYKSFWNKIWESPSLDSANSDPDRKKYRWSLDANGKYFFSLTADHESNGISDTKFSIEKKDEESLTERTEGKLKAGMELSISEINKLCGLWEDQNPLPPEKLLAFKNKNFALAHSGEFIFNFKLEGSKGERGMFWVIPVFQLYDFTLSKVKSVNENGLVTESEEENVKFPLPVSARVLGLKSE